MIDVQSTVIFACLGLFAIGLLLLARAYGDMSRRIDRIERLLPKRHTHRNAETLENLIAQVLFVQARTNETQLVLDALREVLANMRSNPNYESETKPQKER